MVLFFLSATIIFFYTRKMLFTSGYHYAQSPEVIVIE